MLGLLPTRKLLALSIVPWRAKWPQKLSKGCCK